MLEKSEKYTLEQKMVIERAMEGDLQFFFNGEEDIVQYGFIVYTDGIWHITKLKGATRDWVTTASELDSLSWETCEDALNAKIFAGKSLLENLDKVTII